MMFKKLLVLPVLLFGFAFAPMTNAAVVIEYTIFSTLDQENPTITDASLRNICVHALSGSYSSFAADDIVEGVEGNPQFGFVAHICATADGGGAIKAFEKVCVNKLKLLYGALNFPQGDILACIEDTGE